MNLYIIIYNIINKCINKMKMKMLNKQKYLNSLTVKDIYEKNNQFAISYHSTQNQSMN